MPADNADSALRETPMAALRSQQRELELIWLRDLLETIRRDSRLAYRKVEDAIKILEGASIEIPNQ